MKQQTAVEWLFLMLNNPKTDQEFAHKLLNKAKEIEKEQIVTAWDVSRRDIDWTANGQEYYDELFKK